MDLIWPPRSLLSARTLTAPGAVEPELWALLHFLGPPWCARCGFPFATAEPDEALCPACLADPPDFDAARAPLAYDAHSRALALDLKRGARRDGLATFAAWMRSAAAAELDQADLIAPTPLHWTRLAQRRFNQSAWLAQALGAASDKPVDLFALQRTKRRRSQGGLSFAQRAANVRGAFRASPGRRFDGLAIALVDDVLTTGATASACARALKRAGARSVFVVTLARVVRPGAVHI